MCLAYVPTVTTHALYRCPVCKSFQRMEVVWPFWECSKCHARLIPADISSKGKSQEAELLEYYL